MPLSPEKELRNMSSGIMPGSWDAESPSTTKTHEYYERDIGTRKGTSQHPLKEFHHSREIFNFLSSPGEAQPQSLRKAEPSLTTEEVGLFGSLIADEKADRLTKKVMSMEHRLSSHMTLASKAKELAEENRVLREQFNDAQSHIFSLQPYRKDLTPEEVGQDYDALVEQIQDWVQKLVNPWLEDCDDDAHAFLTHAKRRKADANRFKSTDEDIVTSVIIRYLHARVFQSVLYDAITRSVQTISFVENHM
ncbi:4-hydroxyphenylpyruvate dioxygenase [Fusarium oxysporum f. sp. albedinis]|nr:4-hydroxyphenylpyruvate dioxygenase [Fusarium oxysporum f. sp. albedinis]